MTSLTRDVTAPAGSKATAPFGRSLAQLGDDIRRHHEAVERHEAEAERHHRIALAEAIVCGEKLMEAKGRLRHGEFGPFLKYYGVNDRSARVYKQLAANSGSAAVLEATSIRAALEAIAGPSRKPKRLNLGPPCPAVYAGDPWWQKQQWLRAMLAKGRTDLSYAGLPGLHEHFDRRGHPKDSLTFEEAERGWVLPYRCWVCEGWHGGWYYEGEITKEMLREVR